VPKLISTVYEQKLTHDDCTATQGIFKDRSSKSKAFSPCWKTRQTDHGERQAGLRLVFAHIYLYSKFWQSWGEKQTDFATFMIFTLDFSNQVLSDPERSCPEPSGRTVPNH